MCGDPHLPDINGGIYDWDENEMGNNRSPFNTTITYSCVPGAKFTNAKYPNQTQKYTCQWDQSWAPSDPEVYFKLYFNNESFSFSINITHLESS